jgi:hypothetical protein
VNRFNRWRKAGHWAWNLEEASAVPKARPSLQPFPKQHRNFIEFFSTNEHFSGIATRYDKCDDNFSASVQLGTIRI